MNVIGNHMLEYCSQNDISFDYKRILISTNQAERILIATPLLRWYLKNNSEITKIYQIIEYQPKKCLKHFIDKVTEFRIEGDRNPDKAIIGDTYKLLSNSSYGSVLMDKTKHTNVKYLTNKAKMTKIINPPSFKAMEELNHNIFEVETYKSRLTLDTPVQIGFFILQYAKLRMLEFYHDCIVKYFNPNSFELTETDTDSIYMAINKKNKDECINQKYKKKFEKEIFHSCHDLNSTQWFPRRCCPTHIASGRREVGRFKLEFEGTKMISLCSKSYIIENEEGKQKISCKGVSKKTNAMEKFEETLTTKNVSTTKNIGFRINKSTIHTYSQETIGFNYFIIKEKFSRMG